MDLTAEFEGRKACHFKVSEVMRVCCAGAPDVVKTALKDSFLPGDYILATLAGLGGVVTESDLRQLVIEVTRSNEAAWEKTKPRRLALFLATVRNGLGDVTFAQLLSGEDAASFPCSEDVSSPKASVETEEQAVAAEAVKKRFVFAPVVRETDGQDRIAAFEAAQDFPDDQPDDRSDIRSDDMGPDAETVALNPTRWQELDRFGQTELLEQLAKYVPDKEGDTRDAARGTLNLIQKILKGKNMGDLLVILLDDLLCVHYRFTMGLEAARAFRSRTSMGTSTTPQRRAAMLAATAANARFAGTKRRHSTTSSNNYNDRGSKRTRFDPSTTFGRKGGKGGKPFRQ